MRLTYAKLAQIISDKLKSVEFAHTKVESYNPRYNGDDLAGGAPTIVHKIYIENGSKDFFEMRCGQHRSEIEEIINDKAGYYIKIDQTSRFTISDATFWFHKNK